MDAAYHYLSFVRTGFAGALTQADTFGPTQPALATAQFSVAVSGVANPIGRTLSVRGPGDVIGIPATQVVRTDPIDGAVGVEPNYFAQIEFDRPDLPWLFTPAHNTGERLRPWMVLVVLDATGDNACTLSAGKPLPHITITAGAAAQLPDLATSYLWAHAQVITPDGAPVSTALQGDPRLSISRLLCPRHLQAGTSYLAAVVPAFGTGRLAGLGQVLTPDDESKLDPAWQPGQPVDLPVYFSWRFRTGAEADFEALARRLQGRPLPASVGTRTMDVSRPGAGLPSIPPPADITDTAAIQWLDGALRPLGSDSLPQRDPAAEAAFQAQLTVLLDRPADLLAAGAQDPVVTPPIYGDHHALVFRLDGSPPPWLAELNSDTRTRVAAGVGTQTLQQHQEDFVARSWRQLGDVLGANRLLRAAQLARTAGSRVYGRLGTLDPAAVLAVASPMHDRVVGVLTPGVTITKALAASRLPDVTVEPAYRRLGRIGAAASRAAGVPAIAAAAVARFASEAFHAAVDGPDGSTTMRPASEVVGGTGAQALLTAVGGPPGGGQSVDTMVSTLNGHLSVFPEPAAVQNLALRTDNGATAVISSLGAVSATAVSAILAAAAAAAPPAPPPPPPGPLGPPPDAVVTPPLHPPPGVFTGSPVSTDPVLTHAGVLPHGLVTSPDTIAAVRTTAVTGVSAPPHPVVTGATRGVFVPIGASKGLAGGAVLKGGTVTVDTDVISAIDAGTTEVAALDTVDWNALQLRVGLPAKTATADPLTDPGSRLDAIRGDAASITALARVSSGDLAATVDLDRQVDKIATTGAAADAVTKMMSGTFIPVLPPTAGAATGAADLAATHELLTASAAALASTVLITDAPPAPDGPALDLPTAKTALLGRIDPAVTVKTRALGRITSGVRSGLAPRDDLDPVMACPVFNDAMWQAVRDLGNGWLLPGLDSMPPDTVTVVRTNPSFVASFMVGLNHEMMAELLWREYPTDQRGTPFTRFWGRAGAQPDDVGPIHRFHDHLADNLLDGQRPEAVLLLRSELLRRYPGSIIYLSRAKQVGTDLMLDDDTLVLPLFRGDLPPDVSFIGFPVTPDDLRAPGDPWYFVIAQPPTEPRFGLDDPAASTPAVPASTSDLTWSHMSPDGNPATPAAFATADPPALRGLPLDSPPVHWGDSAAVQAHLTYQHPVRVAIRAADLMAKVTGATP
jgi:hypothetical protein